VADNKAPFHSRLYSTFVRHFGRLLGHNILGAEPLNLFYYLAILSCIYFLGREIFNARAGVARSDDRCVWPSFLFHSTQLIRDPLAILCFCAHAGVDVAAESRIRVAQSDRHWEFSARCW
jgi:hypothetical protein